MIASRKRREIVDRGRVYEIGGSATRVGSSLAVGRRRAGSLLPALRTTPRAGTARLTTSVGRWRASLMTATSTGVNAADGRVPGAHIFEHA